MTDDPAKSIRRAVTVAKGLAKKIDQLPSGTRMQAPHPASMIPGVHVMGMDGAQGYADGGSTPAWQRKEGQNPSGGLNSKGRASYHSETGGTLKPPVKAGDNPRRSSFLARMGNMPGPEHDEHGEPTRLLKSLQAWGASSKADARAKAHAIHKDGGGEVDPAAQKALIVARNLSPKGLYSQGAETAAALPQAKGSPQQMMAALAGRGVKSDEMKWSGAQDAFAGQKSVTRDQLAQHFQKNLPDIHETQIPEDDSQYSEYTIPGGSKYRELVIHKGKGNDFLNKAKFHQWVAQRAEYNAIQDNALSGGKEFDDLPYGDQDAYLSGAEEEFHGSGLNPHNTMAYHREPGVGEFQSTHYPQSNVLGHIRMSNRDNGKTLHLEELQSDWGQEARKNPILAQAPYVGKTENWTDLLLKRALHEAASKGYDRLAWTPGQDQADRYGLEHHLHELSYDPEEKTLSHYNSTKGWKDFPGQIEKHEINKHVGKDLSEQLLNSKPHVLNNNLFVRGLDQKVGGEGMRSYYDRIVPQRLADVTKKLGAPTAIEPHTIDANGEQKTLHSIRITPELREAVLKGMPAYARGGDVDLPHKGEGGMLGASKQGENDGTQTAAGDSQNGTQAGELRGQGGLRGSQGVLPAPGPTSGEAPLEGLPRKIKVPRTGATIVAGPDPRVRSVAAQYAQSMGMRYAPPTRYVKAAPERGNTEMRQAKQPINERMLESIQQTHGSEFSSGGNAVTHALSIARKAIKR